MILKYGEVPRLLGACVGLLMEIAYCLIYRQIKSNFKNSWAVESLVKYDVS